jgi:3-hydroxyacyl-CoA dehydrogenase
MRPGHRSDCRKDEWKDDLYRQIAPHLRDDAIIASNTSGLSINRCPKACRRLRRERFCGIHFFNPPRYMHLVELIPAREHRCRPCSTRSNPGW